MPSDKFEEMLTRLEKLVEQLEKGDQPLEASLNTFKEGVDLVRKATQRLDEMERKVEILLKEIGEPGATAPFDDGREES